MELFVRHAVRGSGGPQARRGPPGSAWSHGGESIRTGAWPELRRPTRVCRDGMTREEAEEFVATALELAMARDGSSGGLVRLITITKQGAVRR